LGGIAVGGAVGVVVVDAAVDAGGVGGVVEDVEEEEGGAGVVEGEGEGGGESSGLKVLLVVSGWVDYILHGGGDVLFLFLISDRIMVVVERMALSFSCLWEGHSFNGQQVLYPASLVRTAKYAINGLLFVMHLFASGVPDTFDLLV
jgi:hypothetical protein